MDVLCRRCGEPWDTWHLRRDVWYDANLQESQIKEAEQTFRETGRILPDIREALLREGWEFGTTPLNVKHCPCCKDGKRWAAGSLPEGAADALEAALGDDLDGLQAELEDLEALGGLD